MQKLFRTGFFALFLLSAGSCVTGQRTAGQGSKPPNIIFILTDDQPYGFMGCTGNPIVSTPHLDQLAADGVLFTNAHVTSAICTPSRTSILTSQYERRHGVNFNSGTSLAPEAWAETYPMVLRNNGYYTGWIGKNHVPVGRGGYASGLMEKNFDYWYAGHGHLSFYPKERHEIFKAAKDDTQIEVVGEGVQDFLSNEQKLEGALRFMDQRPTDKPFVLSVCLNLPHSNGTGSMQQRETDDDIYRSLYRNLELPLPENYVAKKDIKTPRLPPELLRAKDRQTSYDFVDTPEGLRERYTRQLQAMTGIDRMVGQIRTKLDREGLADNTVIVFTSDHGLFMGQFGLGGKALCYEQTTHVPMIVFDPHLDKTMRGGTSSALVQTIDIAPTLLRMAGVAVPETYQGKDLNGLLMGETFDVRDYIFTENLWSTTFGNPRCESVQNREWKYIRYYKNETFPASKMIAVAKAMGIPLNAMLYKVHDSDIAVYRSYIEGPLNGEPAVYEELFHLSEDPGETINLASRLELGNVLTRMRLEWQARITEARSEGQPRVLRYTSESEAERGVMIEPK